MIFFLTIPPVVTASQGHPPQTISLTARYKIKDLTAKAEKGDSEAASDLADVYENGDGVPRDPAQAYAWYRKAGELGSIRGLEMAGWHEVHGTGTPYDPAKALESYRKATAAGSGYAAQQLGWMYEEGTGVPPDDAQAVIWYQRAIQQGEKNACGALGWLMENGRGTPKDPTAAAKLYYMGAEAGDPVSQDNLGWLCVSGVGVTQKNYPLALKLFQQAAAQGNARAEGNLGYLFSKGLGVQEDKAEALRWYRKSADNGDLKSQRYLGEAFLNGEIGVRDPSQSLHYALLAASRGDERSFTTLTLQIATLTVPAPEEMKKAFPFLLKQGEENHSGAYIPVGLCYLKGFGTPTDSTEAQTWLMKGAEDPQRSEALLPVCSWLNSGLNGYPKNPELAHALLLTASKAGNTKAATMGAMLNSDPSKSIADLQKLADGGDSMAQYELGIRYQNGDHAPSNPHMAMRLFQEAAEKGNLPAMYHLGVLYQGGILVKKDSAKATAWYLKAKAGGFPPAAARFNVDGTLRPLDDSKVILTTVHGTSIQDH